MFKPLLNALMTAYPPVQGIISALTRAKISASLMGRKDSEETRARKSASRTGSKHPMYGKSLPIAVLDKAAELKGTKVYAYTVANFELVNDKPFRSLRKASENLPISFNKLAETIDSNVA